MGQPPVDIQAESRRIKNFQEVSLGYSKRVAIEEATRCPQCADPVCMQGCPIGINIPGFIRNIREQNFSEAYSIVKKQNPLGSVCGRLCSAPCESACVLTDEEGPIGIRALERFASDLKRTKKDLVAAQNLRGKKIAIVGSGPSGLSAAQKLAEYGYQVTVFDSNSKAGGVLRYGVPEFRLPESILDQEIDDLVLKGVDFSFNVLVGQTMTIDDLYNEGYASILLALGAGIPKFMDLQGTNLGGVYYGEEFLLRVKSMVQAKRKDPDFPLGPRVAIIGSGNTALDCARSAVRLGREVKLIFRRTEDDLRVRPIEAQYAKQEGVQFEPLLRPLKILADQDNFVSGLKCRRLDYADPHENGQWEIMEVPDSDFILETDSVIMAIGHKANPFQSLSESQVQTNLDGTVKVDPHSMQTTSENIFACGNIVSNAGPIVDAMASGKKAAEEIHKYLSQ